MRGDKLSLTLAILSVIVFGAWLSAAWQQPPEGKIDPSDPLLKSIKERMGQLPRLDSDSQGDTSSKESLKKSKGSSGKHRAAELMLKSARLLESHSEETKGEESKGEDSQELLKIAKELRKQVVVVLGSD
ncbi:MAG: hypothetical protein RLZZ396_1782 [Planctomycetota bacterium]|jgi:hypothetical protein